MKKMESTSYEVLDSHSRMLAREARREENARKEREAVRNRLSKRVRESVDDRVARAAKKLYKMNVPATMTLMDSLSSHERDYYLLAEEVGQNRKTILQRFPKVRKSVRLAYYGKDSQPVAKAEATAQPAAAQAQPAGDSPN